MQSRAKEQVNYASREEQPRFKCYADCAARLKSFSSHSFNGPEITEVVKAGFYHTGNEDIVQCFQCGLKLRNWDPSDNPLVEHARHGKHCQYIMYLKEKEKQRKDIEYDSAFSKYTDDLIFTTAAQALLKIHYCRDDVMNAIKLYVEKNEKVEFSALEIATIIQTEMSRKR